MTLAVAAPVMNSLTPLTASLYHAIHNMSSRVSGGEDALNKKCIICQCDEPRMQSLLVHRLHLSFITPLPTGTYQREGPGEDRIAATAEETEACWARRNVRPSPSQIVWAWLLARPVVASVVLGA